MSDRALARMARGGRRHRLLPDQQPVPRLGPVRPGPGRPPRRQGRHRHRYRRRHQPLHAPHARRGLPDLPAAGAPASIPSARSISPPRAARACMGIADRVGALLPGQEADFIVLDAARHAPARPPLRRRVAARPAVRPAGAGRRPRRRRHLCRRQARPSAGWRAANKIHVSIDHLWSHPGESRDP